MTQDKKYPKGKHDDYIELTHEEAYANLAPEIADYWRQKDRKNAQYVPSLARPAVNTLLDLIIKEDVTTLDALWAFEDRLVEIRHQEQIAEIYLRYGQEVPI